VAALTWSTKSTRARGTHWQPLRGWAPPCHVSGRRLNAGERRNAAEGSGLRRKSPSGVRFARGQRRSNEKIEPRRSVVLARAKLVGGERYDDRGGAGVRDLADTRLRDAGRGDRGLVECARAPGARCRARTSTTAAVVTAARCSAAAGSDLNGAAATSHEKDEGAREGGRAAHRGAT
jgi:hypothetical protein